MHKNLICPCSVICFSCLRLVAVLFVSLFRSCSCHVCVLVVFVELVLVLSGCESSTNEFSVPMLMQMNINKACDEIVKDLQG